MDIIKELPKNWDILKEYKFWDIKPSNIKNVIPNDIEAQVYFEYLSFDYKYRFDIGEYISKNQIFLSYSNSGLLNVTCNDEYRPITITSDCPFPCLSISKDFFNSYKEKVINIILEMISKNTSEFIYIPQKELIIPDVLNAIANNPNIKFILLGEIFENDENFYSLTPDVYELFKKSGKEGIITKTIDESLKKKHDPIMVNMEQNLIGNYNFYELQTNNIIELDSLSEEDFNYLKYINSDAHIILNLDNIENMFKAIRILRENNQDNRIIIVAEQKRFNNKNKLNSYIMSHPEVLEYNDLMVRSKRGRDYFIKDYIEYEKKLIDMIKPAMDLSPFEKYLYAYNITKKFKKYKMTPDYLYDESVELYKILDNEFMVCAGYSNLLMDLLSKLGINTAEYIVYVDTGFDRIPNKEVAIIDSNLEKAGHSRVMVNLQDPKYGIDGIYIADPTWDNDMEHDAYNHALMTQKEYVGIRRYNYINTETAEEAFFSETIEEFYLKANKVMDFIYRKLSHKEKNDKMAQLFVQIKFISDYLDLLEPLQPEFVNNIRTSYPSIKSYTNLRMLCTLEENELRMIPSMIKDIMYQLADLTVNKVNNIIAGTTIKDALRVLYEKEGKTEQDIEETMQYNYTRQSKKFPKRIAYFPDGTKVAILNEYNKFSDEKEDLNEEIKEEEEEYIDIFSPEEDKVEEKEHSSSSTELVHVQEEYIPGDYKNKNLSVSERFYAEIFDKYYLDTHQENKHRYYY